MRYLRDLKQQRRYSEALSEIAALRERGQHGAWIDVEEADVLARLERPGQALELLERARLEAPLGDYAACLMAGLLENSKRLDEAADLFEELAGRPALSPLVAQRVLRYLDRADPDRALQLARRLGSDTPGSALNLIRQLKKAKRPEEALELAESSARRFPEDEFLSRELTVLQLAGESPEDAAAELETRLSLQAHRGNRQLQERLIQAYRKSGNLEAARTLLLECLDKDPHNLYFKSNLAYVLRDLGQIETALDLLEQVMDGGPKEVHAETAYIATCREHNLTGRAAAYIRKSGRKHLWGRLRKKAPEPPSP